MNENNTNLPTSEADVIAQSGSSNESQYVWNWDFDSSDSDDEPEYNWSWSFAESDEESEAEYDFSAFESDTDTNQSEDGGQPSGNTFTGGNNPFGGGEFGDESPSGFGDSLAPAEGYEYDFSGVAGEGETTMQTPWDELLEFDEFENVGDILGIEENPFAGGESGEGNPFAGGEGEGNPFAGGGNFGRGSGTMGDSFTSGTDTGVGNTDNGTGNNFIGDSEGETGSNNEANGSGNWYFGNDNQTEGSGNWNYGDGNQTNGNGNWYIGEDGEVPFDQDEPFAGGEFTSGNIPAFAGGGTPSFAGGGDTSDPNADNNQTEGNGNWYFGEGNTTNGNGNWEFGDENQTEGNANWNMGEDNQTTGNANRPTGDGNEITGNGNQPSGDNNQITGNRVSPDDDNQNIVGNGDRYLLMDSEGNVFVVDDESAGDSQYQYDFEFLTNVNEEESDTTAVDQPFVDNIFSQFMNSDFSVTSDTDASDTENPFAGGGFGGGFGGFGGGESEGGNPFGGGGFGGFGGGVAGDSENSDSEDTDSDANQVNLGPFDRLLDIPGVDGPEDIFGNLGAPTGDGDNPSGGFGGGSNPFANWNPVVDGNPLTPEDDMPENENLGFGGFGGDSEGGNPFSGGGFGGFGGGDTEGENPFSGGGFGGFGGGVAGDSEDSDSEGGNPFSSGGFGGGFGGFGGGESEGGNPFGGGGFGGGESEGGNPFGGGGFGGGFGGGVAGDSDGESMQSPWDELLQFEEFETVEDIFNSEGDDGEIPDFVFEYMFDDPEVQEEFANSPIGDLSNFPGVEGPEDIFSTFGVGNDADSENLLEDWNPFTDGNPFDPDDDNQQEPVYNADGDELVVENQFGYLIRNSEDQLYLSVDDAIDENDIPIAVGGYGGFNFPDDLFGSVDDSEDSEDTPEFVPEFNFGENPFIDSDDTDDTDEDTLFNFGGVGVGNPLLEGEEVVIEIDDGYLLNDPNGEWYISRDEDISREDVSLGSNPFSDNSSIPDEIAELLPDSFDDVFESSSGGDLT